MMSEDGRSMQAQRDDNSSVKSESVEVAGDDDDDDDVDMGISFTAAVTASAREGKYCSEKETTVRNACKVCHLTRKNPSPI